MTELRAYKIMFRFLENRYFRLHSDDIGALLGEMNLQQDGKPMDLAIIRDWEQAVEANRRSFRGREVRSIMRAA
jgi:hypothetical protein